MRRVTSLAVSLAVLSALILTSCDGDDDTTTTATPTYQTTLPSTTTSPPATTTTSAPQLTTTYDSSYPLNQQQAYESARAGRAVGGKTPNGDVQVAKSTVIENERKPVQKCGDEYDSYTGDYEYKCETVYEFVRVPKTVFLTSGPAGHRNGSYDNVEGAFAYAAEMGAYAWRLVP